ncbi:hypothetical protein OF83DRAFT_1176892 [Amylostereum chailletii]|nr:hypothetical protein OF83DRAFT_1176892 [Amylostereum chailletii]
MSALTSPAASVKVGDGDASAVTYSGNWTIVSDPVAARTVHESSAQGAAVSLTFQGTSVTAVGQANPPDAPISYLLDGIPSTTPQPSTPRPTDNSSAPFFFIDELGCKSHVLILLVQESGQSMALDNFRFMPCSDTDSTNATTTTAVASAAASAEATAASGEADSDAPSGPPASVGIAIGVVFGSIVVIAALCFVFFGILHKRPKCGCIARRKRCVPPSQSYLASVGAGYTETMDSMAFAPRNDTSMARTGSRRHFDQEATGGSVEFSKWMHAGDDKLALEQEGPSFLPELRESRRERTTRVLSPNGDHPPAYSGRR